MENFGYFGHLLLNSYQRSLSANNSHQFKLNQRNVSCLQIFFCTFLFPHFHANTFYATYAFDEKHEWNKHGAFSLFQKKTFPKGKQSDAASLTELFSCILTNLFHDMNIDFFPCESWHIKGSVWKPSDQHLRATLGYNDVIAAVVSRTVPVKQ